MARPPESTKRRVSHLVGRFEQLATSPHTTATTTTKQSPNEQETPSTKNVYTYKENLPRPRSHHGEISLKQTDRTSSSISPSPFTRSKLTFFPTSNSSPSETIHRKARLFPEESSPLPQNMTEGECEIPRKRCCRDDSDSDPDSESRASLTAKLEREQLSRQGYEEQRKYMERKMESLRQQLSSRDQTEKAERSRADAEVDELRQQLTLSESTRETDREEARVEIQRQQNMSAIRLLDAEARAETALLKAQSLERRLLDLKQSMSMSASTKVEKQVTDQEIAERMGRLNHELQNWVVNSFRKVKIGNPHEMKKRFESLSNMSGSRFLHDLYSGFDPTSKIFTIQATVIYLMMNIFDNDYFFGRPRELQTLQVTMDAMKSPTAPFNDWRSQTFLFLQKAEGSVKEAIDTATAERKDHLISDIATALSTLMKTETTKSQLTSLHKIADHAISLARMLSVQRAVYTCVLPGSGLSGQLLFDRETMENVHDAEDVRESIVKCVTFPAVLKAGDEFGGDMSLVNVIMKAKVLCESNQSDSEEDEDD